MPFGLTALEVVNRALTQIAQGPPLASGTVATNFDGSAAGIYCATLYVGAVQMLLRNQDFEFCRRSIPMIQTGNTPPLQWAYEYAYPDDCIRVRQIAPATWDQNDPQPVRWDVGDVTVTGIIAGSFVGYNGTGYGVGDTGTILGGTGAVATYVIDTVLSAGAVGTYTLTSNGSGYGPAITATATGGTQPGIGTGFFIDITEVVFTTQQVIWADVVGASLIYSTSLITEYDWDSIFTEMAVRFIGSMVTIPVAGRPDLGREMLDTSGKISADAPDRDS